jgi:preprotein translocase subunit SecE
MTKHRKNTTNLSKGGGPGASAKNQPSAQPPQQKPKKEENVYKEPNVFVKLFYFFKDARKELTRVTWPTRKATFTSTGVLLILVAISAVYLALVDGILTRLLRLIVG